MPLKKQSLKEIKKVAFCGILVNLALSTLKFILGTVGASAALVADAVHSLSDLSTDLLVFFGSGYWSRRPDQAHPYGHQRIEVMISTVIGLILAMTAASIAYSSLHAVARSEIVPPRWLAFWGAVFAIVIKESYYRWAVKRSGTKSSFAIRANAWHHRADALSSIPVAIAIASAAFFSGWAFMDRIGALIAAWFIAAAAWRIIKPAFEELSEKGLTPDEIRTLKTHTLSIDEVQDVHAVRARRMGGAVFLDMHICVNGKLSVKRGHEIAEQVKISLLDNFEDLADVLVHLEDCR